jgi:hypothetical protein
MCVHFPAGLLQSSSRYSCAATILETTHRSCVHVRAFLGPGALAFSFSWLVYSLTITLGYYAYFFYNILTNKPLSEERKLSVEPEVEKKEDESESDSSDTAEPRLAFPLRSIRELFPRSGPTGYVLALGGVRSVLSA